MMLSDVNVLALVRCTFCASLWNFICYVFYDTQKGRCPV